MCAGPDLRPRKPSFALPPGATDCHAHVFGPRNRYGYAADRLYTPPAVYLQDYLNMLDAPMPNDGDLCDQLAVWVPDPATRTKILADNPQRLYGF